MISSDALWLPSLLQYKIVQPRFNWIRKEKKQTSPAEMQRHVLTRHTFDIDILSHTHDTII